jgi:hypothetical protein
MGNQPAAAASSCANPNGTSPKRGQSYYSVEYLNGSNMEQATSLSSSVPTVVSSRVVQRIKKDRFEDLAEENEQVQESEEDEDGDNEDNEGQMTDIDFNECFIDSLRTKQRYRIRLVCRIRFHTFLVRLRLDLAINTF